MDDDAESIRRGVLSYMSKVLLQKDEPLAALVIDCFRDNFYDSKKAGLILSCYNFVIAKKWKIFWNSMIFVYNERYKEVTIDKKTTEAKRAIYEKKTKKKEARQNYEENQ